MLDFCDAGKIKFDDVKELLFIIRNEDNWCNSNEYEAIECMRGCRRGKRLKTNGKLYDINDNVRFLNDDYFKIV